MSQLSKVDLKARCNFTSNSNITGYNCVSNAQINSASYPPWDEKFSSGIWLIGVVVVCLLAANRKSNCSLTRAMDGHIVCCGIISSCQSAATSKIVKRFWS